ncbi:MAG: hypothetical protein HRJ53_12905 [Acidobacteria bacterium Pan2503]|uniref:Uncharacterized protein n=1 Tax=Candidatus Acidiferrum panamense TaxID=2741543 RepID=A0A7V8SX40_9BACT|nr:hypothetical protein [Candidatus Acidoferrum panamensis]
MLQVGQTTQSIDPIQSLKPEHGTFLVISPNGERFIAECQHEPGTLSAHGTVVSLRAEQQNPQNTWQITKVNEQPFQGQQGGYAQQRARAAGAGGSGNVNY